MSHRGLRIFCLCNVICLPPLALGCLGGGAKKDSFPYKFHTFVSVTIWKKLYGFLNKILGKKVTGWLIRVGHYLAKERNPSVQIFFWLCFLAHFFFMVPTFYFKWRIPQMNSEGKITKIEMPPMVGGKDNLLQHVPITIINIVGQLIVATLYIASCVIDPGTVTPKNKKQKEEEDTNKTKSSSSNNDNDNDNKKEQNEYVPCAIWPKERYCETCGIIRGPRMHHCRVCNRCISGFDHHCIWINSDVGQGNILVFHLFLLIAGLGLSYIGILSLFIGKRMLEAVSVFEIVNSHNVNRLNRLKFYFKCLMIISPFDLCSIVFHIFLGLVLILFWMVQLPHVIINKLTYESFRWDDLRDIIDIVFEDPEDTEMKNLFAQRISWALENDDLKESDKKFLVDIKEKLLAPYPPKLDSLVESENNDIQTEKKVELFTRAEQERILKILFKNPYNKGIFKNIISALKHLKCIKSRYPNK